MKVVSVTVNYKTADLTLRAVEAVLGDLEPLGGRALVVDNHSQDGSYEKLCAEVEKRGWTDRVEVFASGRNAGFGAGNNIAFRHAMSWEDPPDFFYLLNPDALPDPGGMKALLDFMERTPDSGLAGSRVRHPGGDLRLSAFRFPSVFSELESGLRLGLASRLLDRWKVSMPAPSQTCAVDWVSGASVMLRGAMLDEIGMFDENFFLYFEETDLSLRASRAGWKTHYVMESGAEHIGQVSTGMKDKLKRRPKFWFESRAYYLEKNYGVALRKAADVAWAGGALLPAVRKKLGRPDTDPPRLYRDFLAFNFGRGLD
ncbi:MAG: glycosyltransferase family 2 protein [Nannocystales bacterium]